VIRCYLPPGRLREGRAEISGPEARHLTHVLRIRRGDRVLCFDGMGRAAEAAVEAVSRAALSLQLSPVRQLPPPRFSISLGIGVPGQGILERIVNQAAQLGAHRVIPIAAERSLIRGARVDLEKKRARWQRIVLEAAKQSGNPFLPEILSVTSWRDLIGSFRQYHQVLLASLAGPHEELSALLADPACRNVLLLIGPEGDFSPEEITQAVAAGARRFSLGQPVLRCDTACAAGLSVLSFLLRQRVQ
jgi:16S rRNA (uracil1498-N3)-methyltransferase